MSGHTKGPWQVVNIRGKHYVRRVGAEPGVGSVCQIIKTHDGADWAWHGNARLIAAAPVMLEALERIVAGDIGPDGKCYATFSGSECVEIAQAAIRAAKGEK